MILRWGIVCVLDYARLLDPKNPSELATAHKVLFTDIGGNLSVRSDVNQLHYYSHDASIFYPVLLTCCVRIRIIKIRFVSAGYTHFRVRNKSIAGPNTAKGWIIRRLILRINVGPIL